MFNVNINPNDFESVEMLKALGANPEVVTINVSKGTVLDRGVMMKALNPITRMILQKIFNKQINIIKYLIHYNDKININCEKLFKIVSHNKIFITKQDIINLFTHENIFFTTEDINAIIIALSYNNKHFYSNNSANIEEGIYYKSFENIFNIDKKIIPKKPLTIDDKISILKSIILNTI